MARSLVVFYSLTGHTRAVAKEIASEAHCEVGEIIDSAPRTAVWGRLRAMLEVLFGFRPQISYQGPDPKNFDTIVIGSPIWASHIASPISRFLSERRVDAGRIACFFCYGGQGAEAATAQITQAVGKAPDYTLKIKDEDLKSGSYREGIRELADWLKGTTAGARG